MIIGLGLFLSSQGGNPPYASHAFALDFDSQDYWAGGTNYATLASVPGYTFTRSGEQGAVDSDGSVDWFADNVPAINGAGYHAYGALTNKVLHSQALDNAVWVKPAGTIVTADQAIAPDGTMTADLVEGNGTSGVYLPDGNYGVATLQTRSVFIKSVSGTPTVVLTNPDSAGASLNCALTTSWQRFVLVETVTGGGIWIQNIPATGIHVWQAQVLKGDFPDGGPLIRTAAAAASIGASDLRVNVLDAIEADEQQDFIWWGTADLAPNDSAAFQLFATVNAASGTGYFGINTAGQHVRSVAGDIASGVVPGAGRSAILLRRRAGKSTLAYKLPNGTVTVMAESGAEAFPTLTNNLMFVGEFSNLGHQVRGGLEGVFLRLGTFSDTEITDILEAA